jgi:hypothetical protein
MLHSGSIDSFSRKIVSHFSFLDRLAPSDASQQTRSSLKKSKQPIERRRLSQAELVCECESVDDGDEARLFVKTVQTQ